MRLKVAVIGCGKIADGHAAELRRLSRQATLVAACDRELLMAQQFAQRHGVTRAYDDLDRMLEEERPDVVHLTTPPASHLPLGLRLIEAGCHVYVEKPFALTALEAARLIEAARLAKRVVTVGYFSYFDPAALLMRELVARGALGEPVHVESFYGYDLSGAFGQALASDPGHWVHRLPGKLLQNVIDHMLNKVLEFVPDEDPDVTARAYHRTPGLPADELRVLIQGASTSGYATFSSHIRPAGQFVRVCGTQNTLRVDYAARSVTFEAKSSLPGAFGRLALPFGHAAEHLKAGGLNVLRFARSDFHYFTGLGTLFSRFYESIRDGVPPPISYRDILRISRVMERIFETESVRVGRSELPRPLAINRVIDVQTAGEAI